MGITLANFQRRAIAALNDAMELPGRDIVLKSCTGSGKTIMLTSFMAGYLLGHSRTVFVWLTPGRGDLEEQSCEKMRRYVHGCSAKLLPDVMSSGFEENDVCFINWEKLNKKGNNALKDSEHANFIELVRSAREQGLSFKVIVDESHQNNTIKSSDILGLFHTDKIIRCSATPRAVRDALLIEVPEEDVIAEGLIKKLLIINEGFEQHIRVEDQVSYLIDRALSRQSELRGEYLRRGVQVQPLIIVQLPNRSDALLESVERYFDSRGITYENGLLSVWLSDKKQNLEGIAEPDARPIAVIIKQAVATGWDCPRAQILVKLRDNMSEVFEIQTIGRIRRMPEARHYGSELLDCCYLYTLDEKFTESVKLSLGKDALDARRLLLRPEYRSISLVSQYKTDVPFPRDARLALEVIGGWYVSKYHTGSDMERNRAALEAGGYSFAQDIVNYTKSDTVATLDSEGLASLNDVAIHEELSTHRHGKEYHHCVSEIGLKIGLDYTSINAIIRRLFLEGLKSRPKITSLGIRELYSFVINNKSLLVEDVRSAMSAETAQLALPVSGITEHPFTFPSELMFTFDSTSKSQQELTKNVYAGYLASAEKRSLPEKLFEQYCQRSPGVSWFYKNGDKGPEYLSIVYEDNLGRQKSFYPDYVVGGSDGSIWVIETKGGFTRTGESEDIDRFTAKKFAVLKKYLERNSLRGGIVRQDKQSGELCICTYAYSDDIRDSCWQLLSEVL